jgi:hypothetical protein
VIDAERRLGTALGEMDRFGVADARRPVLPALPAAFERRFIALPSAQNKAP